MWLCGALRPMDGRSTLATCMYILLYFFPSVPDLHIVGTLQAIHVMLDKPQLELIKGLVEMNLGEGIDEFEKPSTVIRDPIGQVPQG